MVTLCACGPRAESDGPPMLTRLRSGPGYEGMQDVEIRGFEAGEVKFIRNVATQYHVRIGCESHGPRQGRFEVMRVLQRWDLSFLPPGVRVLDARLVLRQESTESFPHFTPLRFPVTFYAYRVKRRWEPGAGGIHRDNLSRPATGEAWWLEARAGEASWRSPGCGYASDDDDDDADREAQPLAWGRVLTARDTLELRGPRLAAAAERSARERRPLDLLLKASDDDELRPGSVKCFTSADFGTSLGSARRPCLELTWQAPCSWSFSAPVLIEPGARARLRASPPPQSDEVGYLCAALAVEERASDQLPLEVFASGWSSGAGGTENDGDEIVGDDGDSGKDGARARSLVLPLRGRATGPIDVTVSGEVHAVPLGEELVATLLETWTPAVAFAEDLEVRFTFVAPSGRALERRARHTGGHLYEVRFVPDEPGFWRYTWRTRPDRHYAEQHDEGYFTVLLDAAADSEPLVRLVEAVRRDAASARSLDARRRLHYRLASLQRALHTTLLETTRRDETSPAAERLREALDEVTRLLRLAGS